MNLQQTCDFGLEFCVTHTEHIQKLGIAFGKTVIYFYLGSIKQKAEEDCSKEICSLTVALHPLGVLGSISSPNS